VRDASEQAQSAARPTGANGLGSAIGRALRPLTALLAAALLVAVVSACGGEDAGGSSDAGGKVSLVGFSTPQVVYDEVVPAFRRTDAGRAVDVATSFGPSASKAARSLAVLLPTSSTSRSSPTSHVWSMPASSPATGSSARTAVSSRTRWWR